MSLAYKNSPICPFLASAKQGLIYFTIYDTVSKLIFI